MRIVCLNELGNAYSIDFARFSSDGMHGSVPALELWPLSASTTLASTPAINLAEGLRIHSPPGAGTSPNDPAGFRNSGFLAFAAILARLHKLSTPAIQCHLVGRDFLPYASLHPRLYRSYRLLPKPEKSSGISQIISVKSHCMREECY